jgi:hypothetical protein
MRKMSRGGNVSFENQVRTFNWTKPLMIDHMQDNSIPGVPMIHILQIHILK